MKSNKVKSNKVKSGIVVVAKIVLAGIVLGGVVLGGLAAPMTVTTARAAEDDDSARTLLPYCKLAAAQAGNKAYVAGRCVGLVQGVAEALVLMKQADADNTITRLCVDRPKRAGAAQAVEAVVRYGEAHPEQMRAPFTVVVALALTEAWTCAR